MHDVEKSRDRAPEARKMHFCTPRRVFAHAYYKHEFDDAERLSGCSDDNRTQKLSNYVQMRSKNKVALAVELSIHVCRQYVPCEGNSSYEFYIFR